MSASIRPALVKPVSADKVKVIGDSKNPDYVILNITKPKTPNPIGILAFDFDLTLVGKNKVVINEAAIAKAIEDAYSKDFLIVIVTGRQEGQVSNDQIKQVIEKIAKDKVSTVYYTNGKNKMAPLENLYQRYFPRDPNGRSKVCLVDDDGGYLVPCQKAGMTAIPVDAKNEYLNKLQVWMDARRRAQFQRRALNSPTMHKKASLAALIKSESYDLVGAFIDNLKRPITAEERTAISGIKNEKVLRNLMLRLDVNEYLHYETKLIPRFLWGSSFTHQDKVNAAKAIQKHLQGSDAHIDAISKDHAVIADSKKLTQVYAAAKALSR